MRVIVDYNNIDARIRRSGPKYISERIARCLGPTVLSDTGRLAIRLYDGWYEAQSLTQLAQQISIALQKEFPTTVTMRTPEGKTVKTIVSAEMAYSLHCDPKNHIWHTYRPRTGQSNIKCNSPSTAGCVSTTCVLSPLPHLFSQRKCPDTTCRLTTDDLIIRSEQKLVDSMMSVDLMSLHLTSQEALVVVSSDDDLWPALRLLLQRGHTLYHIHTDPTRRTPSFYSNCVPQSQYIQLTL